MKIWFGRQSIGSWFDIAQDTHSVRATSDAAVVHLGIVDFGLIIVHRIARGTVRFDTGFQSLFDASNSFHFWFSCVPHIDLWFEERRKENRKTFVCHFKIHIQFFAWIFFISVPTCWVAVSRIVITIYMLFTDLILLIFRISAPGAGARGSGQYGSVRISTANLGHGWWGFFNFFLKNAVTQKLMH